MLHALCCWYDEDPRFLERAVYTATRIGVRRVVALDGAYELYPEGTAHSPAEQPRALLRAANDLGLEITFPKPKVWESEVEKRQAALDQVPDGDWLCWLDADFEIMSNTVGLPGELRESGHDVGEVRLRNLRGPFFPSLLPIQPLRWLFHKLPGLHFVRNHYTIVAGNGKVLWGSQSGEWASALDLTDKIEVVHHTNARAIERVRKQVAYYKTRDALGVERGPCGRCGAPAVGWSPGNLKDLGNQVEVEWMEVCEPCADELAELNAAIGECMGVQTGLLPRLVGKHDLDAVIAGKA